MLPQGRVYLACSSLGVGQAGRGWGNRVRPRLQARPNICAKMILSPPLSRPVIKGTMFLLSLVVYLQRRPDNALVRSLFYGPELMAGRIFVPPPRRQTNREYCGQIDYYGRSSTNSRTIRVEGRRRPAVIIPPWDKTWCGDPWIKIRGPGYSFFLVGWLLGWFFFFWNVIVKRSRGKFWSTNGTS